MRNAFRAPLTLVACAASLLPFTLPASANYKEKALTQTDWVQKHFYDAKARRYHPKFPVNPKELPYDFMWANGVAFSMLVGAARYYPTDYVPTMNAFRKGLDEYYWDPQAPNPAYNAYCSGPGGTDKYYDDNEWMVLTFAEAYEITHDPAYRTDAERTAKFVLSGWDDVLGGGIYWKLDHKSKNTCSNGPAAAGVLRLYALTDDRTDLEWGRKIRDWTNAHLLDSADSLYWDNQQLDGHVEKTKWSYNAALMIRTDLLLAPTQTGDAAKATLAEARRVADAGIAAWTDPANGSLQKTEDTPLFTHLFCEALVQLYDVTHDLKYLNAVRREAAFAYRHARDPQGGYWDKWTAKDEDHAPGARKSLIDSAATARIFWLLAPYKDVDELYESGFRAAQGGSTERANLFFQQAADSDPEARAELTLTPDQRTALEKFDKRAK